MSRPIKFRVWYENVMRGKKVGDDIVWSKTSYYDYDPIIDNEGLCSVEGGWDIQGHEDKNDYVLEQFTGLKDKSGKEIYEGDIMEFGIAGDENRGVVGYEEDFGSYETYTSEGYIIAPLFTSRGKIIGNLHENPELLGGEK